MPLPPIKPIAIIPLARLTPISRTPPKPITPITVTATVVTDGPPPPDPTKQREEFDNLHIALLRHKSGEEVMEALIYKKTLSKALDIITQMNQTTAGPKASNKKIGADKKTPTSLADL